jgi:hypothetical protein
MCVIEKIINNCLHMLMRVIYSEEAKEKVKKIYNKDNNHCDDNDS